MNLGVDLLPVSTADVDDVHALFSDPGTWRHFPSGRFTDVAQTVALIERFVREWDEVGLSQWAVRDGSGPLLGLAGVVPRERWWNLGYRFTPSAWGRGLATDVSIEAIARARGLRPDLPVITRSLATNPASGRVAERAGLQLAWRGPSTDGPERLIHADRELAPDVLAALVQLG